MENDEDFLELNQNIYFKKSPKKSKKDHKKITISTNCTEENIKNIKKFEPDLVTIKMLERMLEIENKTKSLIFFSNQLRRNFNNNLLKSSTNLVTTMNELFKETFNFINEFKGSDGTKHKIINKRSNKNSVFIEFKSSDDIKNIILDIKKIMK
jgi:hypothetical protein